MYARFWKEILIGREKDTDAGTPVSPSRIGMSAGVVWYFKIIAAIPATPLFPPLHNVIFTALYRAGSFPAGISSSQHIYIGNVFHDEPS